MAADGSAPQETVSLDPFGSSTLRDDFVFRSKELDAETQFQLAEKAKQTEHEREIDAKQKEHAIIQAKIDATWKRRTRLAMLVAVAAVVGYTLSICVEISRDPNASVEAKQSANQAITGLLSASGSGLLGYLAGSKTG